MMKLNLMEQLKLEDRKIQFRKLSTEGLKEEIAYFREVSQYYTTLLKCSESILVEKTNEEYPISAAQAKRMTGGKF